MKKYIKPTLDIENITMDSSIMVGSEVKGEWKPSLILKSKEFDFEDETDEEEEW